MLFLWDRVWILVVDEATRYNVCSELADQTVEEILSALVLH